jgi:ribosomal protein L37AE/L43A
MDTHMTQAEHDFECIALRGQCPDCSAIKLEQINSIIYCRGCHAAFMAGEVFVQRVTLENKIMPTAKLIKKGHAFWRSPESDRV